MLTASTGGGHDMRARSFERWASELTDWQVSLHWTLENTHPLYRLGVETYNVIQRYLPVAHHAYFGFLEVASLHRGPSRIAGGKQFQRVVRELDPDVVLSTHAHLNHGFFVLARHAVAPKRLRCVTYCGELAGGYGFSRHWASREADLFIGAVEETTATARRLGLDPARTVTGGFLLDPRIYDPPAPAGQRREFVRDTLELDPDTFTLLLATGAAGANNHLALLEEIHAADLALQCVVLCGKNPRTLERVREWGRANPGFKLKALGYWSRMPILLHSVSAVVARPGSGLASEAIVCGRPLILNGIGGVMPQERLTTAYLASHDAGLRIARPADLVPIVRGWLSDEASFARARCAIAGARPGSHPRDVLELVAGIAPPGRSARPRALAPAGGGASGT
ncbi:MAG: UDP-N-acetylglucosamine--LPS N-acetylglucosamine transferase [Gammaproteobacteria bacterium]